MDSRENSLLAHSGYVYRPKAALKPGLCDAAGELEPSAYKKGRSVQLKIIHLFGVLCISACAVEAAEGERDSQTTQGVAEAPPTSVTEPEDWRLAPTKLAAQSCLAGAPVEISGEIAELPEISLQTQACNTYTGTCMISGCSRAAGEGWEFTTCCGTFLYSWLTICNGQPSSWGIGICLG